MPARSAPMAWHPVPAASPLAHALAAPARKSSGQDVLAAGALRNGARRYGRQGGVRDPPSANPPVPQTEIIHQMVAENKAAGHLNEYAPVLLVVFGVKLQLTLCSRKATPKSGSTATETPPRCPEVGQRPCTKVRQILPFHSKNEPVKGILTAGRARAALGYGNPGVTNTRREACDLPLPLGRGACDVCPGTRC
jgi:hypothetical protein